MKIFKISALMLIGLALIISIAKWDNIERLYHVITLFDEDVIVENFSRIKTLVPTSEVKPSTEASSFDTGYQALPATFTYKEEKRRFGISRSNEHHSVTRTSGQYHNL
jgi:hypothetical protein